MCKAVIRNIAPEAEVLDISHLIAPFGVREGAMVLAEAAPYFRAAIHLAVVDPGVGSSRRPVIVMAGDGSLLVGPDNGLLLPAAGRLRGVDRAWLIDNPDLRLPGRSNTFHGRDVFAPAAAHLALGVSPDTFGPEVPVESLVRVPSAPVQAGGDHFRGEVLLVDRFGNLQTSLRRNHLVDLGLRPGDPVQVRLGDTMLGAVVRETYSHGPPGEVQIVEDSHGSLALCVNRGSAARLVEGVRPGFEVLLGPPGFHSAPI